MKTEQQYALVTETSLSYEDALEKVTALLKEEGFGILTEIDVKATLKAKINQDFTRYKILGACNPSLAHRSLEAENLLGVFLPCNVVVYEREDGTTVVAAMEPRMMAHIIDNPRVKEVSEEVGARLDRVMEKIKS